MFALLLLLAGYLLGGFLLGHLYRDAIDELSDEMVAAAETRLADVSRRAGDGSALRPEVASFAFAEYHNGRKSAGDPRAPADWPAWLEARERATSQLAARVEGKGEEGLRAPLFVALPGGAITAAAAMNGPDRGVLVFFDGDLAAGLRQRTHVWLELLRDDDPRRKSTTRLSILGREIRLGTGVGSSRTAAQTEEYFRLNPPRSGGSASLMEKPVILWMESNGPLPALADGQPVAADLAAALASSPATLFRALLSTSAEVDSAAWLALAGIAVLFTEIYFVAAAIAIFMIFGLSRAVNRLSRATEAIASGDFSTRIPVRRKDQIGELQRSFNSMSEHLEELIQTEAQKEALDKEIALARKVQQELLPESVVDRPGVEFATHFEPSAAIGGDYYDILEAKSGRIAVMIADVAGHGLAAGLRMAMIKAAVTLQIEDAVKSAEIFARLHRLLRRMSGDRSFVTASLSVFDARSGALVLTNAGHPPAYRVGAAGEVEELLAPGVPLGSFSGTPGRLERRIVPGDSLVWLSDGLIEATDANDRQFGYPAVERALAGPSGSAAELRDRLLAAVRAYSGGRPPEDDRTLVVMRYLAATVEAASPTAASTAAGDSPR
jgi:serine phosphatase RsbU (regulator of sigma subunit)